MIEEWVEQCRNGQVRSYAQIVRTLQHRMLNFLYRMTQNREMAEDIGQEVFLKAFRRLDQYDRAKASFSTWLFTLARNLCLDELRKRRMNLVSLDDALTEEASVDPGPFQTAVDRELETKIKQAIQSLTPEFREVFVLKEYGLFSIEEIAAITGSPTGTVKSRLHRARVMLQEKLAPMLAS